MGDTTTTTVTSDDNTVQLSGYCVPIDISGQDVENVAIATTLGDTLDAAENGMIRLVLNFTAFVVMLLCVVFGAPYIYKVFLVDLIIKGVANGRAGINPNNSNGQIATHMYSALMLFYGIVFVMGFWLIVNSAVNSYASQMIIGIFLILFLMLFIGRISFYVEELKDTKKTDPKYTDIFQHYGNATLDFITIIINSFENIFSTKGLYLLGGLIISIIIYTVPTSILGGDYTKSSPYFVFNVLLSVYLANLIDTYSSKPPVAPPVVP
jgi:hypothetical protein